MIYSIIPARSGSKGIPDKNIKCIGGYPLIAYSIIVSNLCNKIQRTIVSTDSEDIANVALHYGAEVPFLRPKEFSKDESTDIEFVIHALNWFQEYEGQIPRYLIHLRPTTPLRTPEIIDKAVTCILSNSDATSLRSVNKLNEPVEKLFHINKNRYLTGLCPNDPRPEYYNLPRQSFAPTYQSNGYVDIINTNYVLKYKNLHGPKILAFITPKVTELDTVNDVDYLEFERKKNNSQLLSYLKNHFPLEK